MAAKPQYKRYSIDLDESAQAEFEVLREHLKAPTYNEALRKMMHILTRLREQEEQGQELVLRDKDDGTLTRLLPLF